MNSVTDFRSDFKRFLLNNSMTTQEVNQKNKADELSVFKQFNDGDQVMDQNTKRKLVDTSTTEQQNYSTFAVKDAAKSSEYCDKGDQACKENRLEDATYLYTLALLYAPNFEKTVDSSSVALAHEKRSALFFQLHQWSNCLADIDCAIKSGHNFNAQPLTYRALLIRKVECLIALGQYKEARRLWATEDVLTSTDNPIGPEENYAQQLRLEHLQFSFEDSTSHSKLESDNPFLKTVSSLLKSGQYKPSEDVLSLSAKVKPIFGSSTVVATSHIDKGEVIAVEAPYLTALYKEYELLFCHFCCRSLESTNQKNGRLLVSGPVVPCTDCTRVLYCSPTCRDISWSAFHRFECSILPILHQSGVAHLALRILLSTGLNTISLAIQEKDDQSTDATDLVSLYSQLYNVSIGLSDATDEKTAQKMVNLAKQCGFFSLTNARKEEDLAHHVVLRHMLQLKGNAHRPVSVLMSLPPFPSAVNKEVLIADALYPVSALFERSKDANVLVNFVNGHQMVVNAAKKIAPGEKVLMPSELQQVLMLTKQ